MVKMVGESQVSDPVEPLQESGIFLLPRTIRAPADVPLPLDPNDPEAVHSFMKSKVLDCPERAMDEARIILDKGTTELLNGKFGNFLESMGIDKDDLALEGKEKPRQRREGLGRKRAHFAFKPVMSQPSENLEPNFNFDKLQDPSEFFAAFEKLEYARKEIQILKGDTSSSISDYDPSNNRRQRRPGILGKSANYKHRYSSSIPEDEYTDKSTQESLVYDASPLASQGHDKLSPKTNPPNPEQEEIDREGSIIETENKVSEILDELLSIDDEDLNGNGALNLLQERLQMKPIDIEDLSIPDFHDMGRTNFKALAERLPRTRKSSSNIGSLSKKPLGGTTPKSLQQSASSLIGSPTPPKSPFAAISLLKKRNSSQSDTLMGSPTPPKSPFAAISLLKKRTSSQSDTQRDPFSPLKFDFTEQRNPYSDTNIDKESNLSEKQRQDMEEDGCVGVIASPLDKDVQNQQVKDIDFISPQRSQDMIEQDGCFGVIVSPLDKNIQNQQVKDTDFISPHRSQDMIEQCSEMNTHGKTNMFDISEGQEETERDSSSMHSKEGFLAEQAAEVQESGNMDLLDESIPLTDELTPVGAEDDHINKSSNVAEINAEQNVQEQHRKTKRPWVTKAHPLRPSIADGGTSFETGVRRSKRIKTRRLEYWKGERFLYGRVNESMKVIGMKYISPAKGGGIMKVKSYVPDEYKEIVEFAAASQY